MKPLRILGIVLVLLGLVSLFVPIPVRERHGIQVGDANIGFETSERQRVHPAVSAVLVGGGILLLIVSIRGRR